MKRLLMLVVAGTLLISACSKNDEPAQTMPSASEAVAASAPTEASTATPEPAVNTTAEPTASAPAADASAAK